MKQNPQRPIVYDYRDLTEYLKDFYKYRKRNEPSFSYEKWAEEMGLKSRSYLRYLVLGEKIPSAGLLPSLLKGLQLDDEETSYFITLFNYQSAPNNEIKAVYTRTIFRAWTRRIQEIEIPDISEFLSDALVPQLFTYLSFEDSPSNLDQWSRDLNCDSERIKKALKCLIWQKLVNGAVQENGDILYRAASPYFRVPSGASSIHIRAFHLEGLKQAQAAIQDSPENRKMYSAFFALSPEQFARAQELVQDFNKQLLTIFNEKSIDGKKLYRLNQQLIPVSQIVRSSIPDVIIA